MAKDESRKAYDDSPRGWQERWTAEMEAATKFLEKFTEQGTKIVDRYLDVRTTNDQGYTRLNLFHSGINTMRSMLYGQVPKVDFDRRFADSADDAARVASTMLERMLNADIERPGDDYTAVLRSSLDDRLIPGLGIARVRYEAEFEDVKVPALYSEDGVELAPEYLESRLKTEQVKTDYVHWKDFRWSYARTWHEVRWVAFRAFMDYDELTARFGEEKADKVPLKNQYKVENESKGENLSDIWGKGEVWEIWNKEDKKIYWWVEGLDEILDSKDDILGLANFFPCPRPLIANPTTGLLVPRADFVLTQDLYDEIDVLNTRITKLTAAIRVVGVYDKKSTELKRILEEGVENTMIPVENWAMFAEKQGLKGQVDWFPLEAVVNTLDKLRELLQERINLLYQVTGLSDILRGQSASSDRVSATEQSIKAKFASVRMQALQDEFARFGTDLIRLKAEVAILHCQPETIIRASNIMFTQDADKVDAAMQVLQNRTDYVYRIYVRPESMAMVDYQSLQADRMAYLNALATYLQSSAPMLERLPNSLPTLLELLKWGLAGFKGSDTVEGAIDRAIEQALEALKNPPPKPPDPAMIKLEADMEKMRMEAGLKQQEMQMEMQMKGAELQFEFQKFQQEMQQDREKFLQEMRQDQQKFLQEMMQASVKLQQQRAEGEQKLEMKERESEVSNGSGSSAQLDTD